MIKNYILSLLTVYFFALSNKTNSQVIVTLGSGTNAHGNTTAGPINEWYESLHCQIVYTASEINAAGGSGGSLLQLGFYVVSGVTDPLPNYTIKLKHTTSVNASIYDGVGLTTYYTTPSYNPPAGGFNMLTLSTPFNWNGIDNILVDVCFDPVLNYSSTGVVRIYNPTVTDGMIFVRADGVPQCGLNCSTTSVNKPQIQFAFAPSTPLDLGVTTFLNPIATKPCFGTDTIIARIKNFGTAVADFSTTPTVLTVNTTGPIVSTFTVPINTGTLASNATQDFTISTSFNMSTLGTYKFKGYTTVTGDGSALNDTTNLTVNKTPFFTTSALPNDSVCLGVPVQLNSALSSLKQVGNGAIINSSTSYPAPYGNFYMGAKHQFLFLASELTAAGLSAGNITSLSLNATNLNASAALVNYNMAISTTTLTSITNFANLTFTTYVSVPSYTPVLGINTHTFSTPFVWDGVSNLIIETCFNNQPAGYTNNVSFTQSSTAFSSSVWFNADSDPAVCTTTTTFNSMNQRPNFYFGQPSVATYSWSTAGGLSAANIANPIANINSTKTYTISVTKAGGCMSYDTVRIFIKPTPTPNLGSDTLVCSLPFLLNSNTTANSFIWNTGATTSAINVTTGGKYWVKGTNTNGCQNTDTVKVTLSTFPIVTLGPDTGFCQGSFIHLYAGNPGCTYSWTPGGATTSSITVSTIGAYSVAVTNTAGCKSSDIVNVVQKTKPTVGLVFTGPTRFCTTDGVRALNEGTPAGGTYIGAGITGSTFNPNQAGQGTYIVIYSYTGPNGCSNTANDTLAVNACVGLEELANDLGLNVYPNPNTGIFTLEINTANDIDANVSIMSIDSKLVYNEKVSGSGIITQNININDLANGIYYLQVKTKDTIKTYKVLKQ